MGQGVSHYMEVCNRRTQLIPQCETREALEQIEKIASMPGVDGIFVGPCDLSIDLGIPLQFDHPILIHAIERILAACQKAGKTSYIFAGNMKDAVRWADKGFDCIAYSLDVSVFINAFQSIVSDFHKEAGK
jgi:4-hydroxy-2-oxoheptanedioate aldolase